jgi:hypothetical protein
LAAKAAARVALCASVKKDVILTYNYVLYLTGKLWLTDNAVLRQAETQIVVSSQLYYVQGLAAV